LAKSLLQSKKPLKPVIPRFHSIDGRQYVNLRDMLQNLVINQILQTDYQLINKKVNVVKEHARDLSPKHRKRLLKQLRKGIRKVNSNAPTETQTTPLM
jgi:hypothetical protein